MSTLSELEYSALAEQTGVSGISLDAQRVRFYDSQTGKNGSNPIQAEISFLQQETGLSTSHSETLWRTYMVEQGVTYQSSLNDMKRDFWQNVGYSNYYSLLYNGTNNTSSIANDNSYQGLAIGTIEFFFKTGYGGAYQKLMQKVSAFDIGITQDFGGGAKLFAKIDGVKDFGELTGDVSDNAWHNFAIAWNESTIEAYFDGIRVGSDTSAGSQTSDVTTNNVGWNGTGEFFNGNFGFLRISDIKRYTGATMTVPTKPFVLDANTVLLPDYTIGSGLTVTDLSGNGNDLDLDATNPPSWSEELPF